MPVADQVASNAFSSQDTTLKIGSPLVLVAEITNSSGPDEVREIIDITTLNSPGGRREKITGLRDGGQISLDLNFTRVGFDVFQDEMSTEIVTPYEVKYNDAGQTTFSGNALVVTQGRATSLGDRVTMSVVLEITGEETLTT